MGHVWDTKKPKKKKKNYRAPAALPVPYQFLQASTWARYLTLTGFDQNQELVHFGKLTPPHNGRMPKMQMPVHTVHSTQYPVPSTQYSTVQYSTVQYSTVQYSTVQYSTVQYSTVQYSTVQYSTVQYSTVQYSTVQYSTVQYSTVQYSTVQYSTVQYSTVQYSTVQYSTVQYSTVQYSTVQYSTVQYSTVQYSTVQYSTGHLHVVACFPVGWCTIFPPAQFRCNCGVIVVSCG